MKVLIVHSRYRSVSGEEAVVERELSLLNAAGHDARLLQFENGRGARSMLDLALAANNPSAARRVREMATSFKPDVIHVHNTWFAASPSVMSAGRACGVPVVATLHNYRAVCAGATLVRDGESCTDCFGGSVLPGVRHRCVNGSLVQSLAGATVVSARRRGERAGHLADLYIAPTERLAQSVIEGGIPAHRVTVLAHFAADPGPLGLVPSASRTIVYAGRLSPEKGIQQAVEAWDAIVDRPDDARFLIAGEGPLESELKGRQIGGIEFLGRVPPARVDELIDSARFVVVPSLWDEPFGLVYLEAMGRGVPVLSTSMGAAPLFLADGGGWMSPPGDVDAMSTLMKELLSCSHDVAAGVDHAGKMARMTYVAGYSPEVHLNGLLAIYEKVTVSGGRAS